MARARECNRVVEAVAPPRDAVRAFARWAAESVEPPCDVLNIGAGRNLSGAMLPVRRRASSLVGVDPDASIWENPHLDARHQLSLEDFAADHPAEFDVALAVFVLEHVRDPRAFAAACSRVLRPGGVLFALTVNKYQYFGMATWATTRLHVNDQLLRHLKGDAVVDAYHFPTVYRLNSPRQCARRLGEAGFCSVEFRMFDKPDLYAWYLPEPLKPLAVAWSRAVYALRVPGLMGSLSLRAVKADDQSRPLAVGGSGHEG